MKKSKQTSNRKLPGNGKKLSGDEAWERILNDPRPRPKLVEFIRKAMEEGDEPMNFDSYKSALTKGAQKARNPKRARMSKAS